MTLTLTQVLYQGTFRFAEVQFYFQAAVEGIREALALCSLYSPADERRKEYSNGALIVCNYGGQNELVVIRAKTILSVVAMVPLDEENEGSNEFYLVENSALGVVHTSDFVD